MKVNSSIGYKGIYVRRGNEERLVRISGDEPEKTPGASFKEGMLKGAVMGLLGPVYTDAVAIYKAVEGATKAYDAVREEGGSAWDATKAALKGAFLGGVKGWFHGAIDYLIVGSIAAAAVSTVGIIGLPIAAVAGGIYNVVKDAIRS